MRTRLLSILGSSIVSVLVAACGGGGGGGDSAPTVAPANVMLTPAFRSMTIAWDAVPGASSYNVYVASAPGVNNLNYGGLPDGLHVPAAPQGPITVFGLSDGRTYFVVVTARNEAGEGPYSAERTATLLPGAPVAPTLFPKVSALTVSWPLVASAVAYDVYFAKDGSVSSANWAGLSGGQHLTVASPPILVEGLDNGTPYFAVVTATNFSGTGPESPAGMGAPSGRGTFTSAADVPTGAGPSSTVSARLDADALLDLAVVSADDSTVSVFFGNGDGTFFAGPVLATGAAPSAVLAADLNADGFQDLVTTNPGDGTVSVLLGDGFGGFADHVDSFAGASPVHAAVGSIDPSNGMALDLVVADAAGASVQVLLGNGDGTFGGATAFPTGNGPGFVAVIDTNGDGLADVVTTNAADGTVTALLSDGTGGFFQRFDSPAGPNPTALSAVDFDGDLIVDLAVTGGTAGDVTVLRGAGDGTFALGVPVLTGAASEAVVSADFDGDGRIDLAVANRDDGTVSVLLGNGVGGFLPFIDVVVGSGPVSLTYGDLNGDGIPDLVATNELDGTLTVLLGSPM